MTDNSSSLHDLDRWNAAAGTYMRAMEDGEPSSTWHLSDYFAHMLQPLSGRRIADLGCGHGWLTEQLRTAGAEIVGIDGSSRFLDAARQRYPECTFLLHDLSEGLAMDDALDAAVFRFSLSSIRAPERLIADLGRAVREGGRVVITMPHPCFYPHARVEDEGGDHHRRVTGYLDHRVWDRPDFGGYSYFHRPLSWYVQSFVAEGFLLSDLTEPRQLPDTAVHKPPSEWTDYERWWSTIPTFIGMTYVRRS